MPPEGSAPTGRDERPLFEAAIPPCLDALPGALAALRTALLGAAHSREVVQSVELVLAEALTNIVRHARPPGPITLVARRDAGGLAILLEDDGRALPGGRLPATAAPAVDVPESELPEDGFGLFLIRTIAGDLAYTSDGGRNRLAFHVPAAPGGSAAKMP